jgi:uncharacterized protein
MTEQFDEEKKVSDHEKAWSIVGHLSSFVGLASFIISSAYVAYEVFIKINIYSLLYLIIPVILNILIPLIIWSSTKRISSFVEEHVKQSLNFQMSVTFYFIISVASVFVAVGIVLLPVLVIFDISVVIKAYEKAALGENYRYPLSIHFFR